MRGIGIYTKDFMYIKEDLELIKENIRRVLLTSPGERIGNPYFGCYLKNLIFEPEPIVRSDIEDTIIQAIERWVPNVKVLNFSSETNPKENNIKVNMEIQSTELNLTFDYDTLINY